MSDSKIDKLKSKRKIEAYLIPGPITRFFNAINPMYSLGKVAGKNFHENSLTISIILLFSFTVGVLTTIMFINMGDDVTNSIDRPDQHLVMAAMVISWFVFTNFLFLVFEATRLFNILLFTALIILIATAVTNINQQTLAARLGIASIAIATIPLIILSYYYLASEGDEVVELKTLEREKRTKEEVKLLLAKYKKDAKEEIKKELEEDVTSQSGIKRRIADAYIEALIKKAESNVGASNKEKGKEDKKKKEEEEKKKKKEEE